MTKVDQLLNDLLRDSEELRHKYHMDAEFHHDIHVFREALDAVYNELHSHPQRDIIIEILFKGVPK